MKLLGPEEVYELQKLDSECSPDERCAKVTDFASKSMYIEMLNLQYYSNIHSKLKTAARRRLYSP